MVTVVQVKRKIKSAEIIGVESEAKVTDFNFEEFERTPLSLTDEIYRRDTMFNSDAGQSLHQTEQENSEEEATYSIEEFQVEVQQAYERGFSDGKQVTGALLDTEMNTLREWIKNLDTTIIELKEQYAKQVEEMQRVAIELSMIGVEHILRREVSENVRFTIDEVERAIMMLNGVKDVRVRVHPSNIEALESQQSSLLQNSSVQGISFIADSSVEIGGCVLETNLGIIDTQLSTQLYKLRSAMADSTPSSNESSDNYRTDE
jgi:flagellar assembly protein FliH